MAAPYRWIFRPLATAAILAVAGSTSFAQSNPAKANPHPGGTEQPRNEQPKNRPAEESIRADPDSRHAAALELEAVIGLADAVDQRRARFPDGADLPAIDPVTLEPGDRQPSNGSVHHPTSGDEPIQQPIRDEPIPCESVIRQPAALQPPVQLPVRRPRLPPIVAPQPERRVLPAGRGQRAGSHRYKAADLQVNPTADTVYQPISGIVTLADGSTFYRVTGSGASTMTGDYATGNGLYNNPLGGSFFNPSSGTFNKPAYANIFMPYIW